MNISALSNQLVILFFIAILGYAGSKAKLLHKDTNKILADLVLNIGNPCTLLYSVLGSPRTLSNQEVLILTAVSFGTYGLVMLAAEAIPKLLRVPKDQAGPYRFMTVFSNVGFLGIPIVSALYGSGAVFLVSIFNIGYQIPCFTYGVRQMATKPEDRRFSVKMLCSPMVIVSLVAYGLYLGNVTAPKLVVDALATVGGLTSPCAMLTLGCAMAAVPLGQVFRQYRVYPLCVIKLVILPLLIYALTFWWMDNPMMLGVTVTLWAMPVGSNATLFAARYDRDQTLAAAGVFLSTVLCMVTLPALLQILF